MYAMFAVIGDTKKVKKIVNILKKIGIKGATIIDTMGGGSYFNSYLLNRPVIGSALRAVNDTKIYNKTILSIVYCENHLNKAMDAIEETLGGNMKNAGTGIVFAVPVEEFRGGALERYLQKQCETGVGETQEYAKEKTTMARDSLLNDK